MKMKVVKNICCVFIFIFINVQAVNAETITLDQAIEFAIRNNPSLKAAQAELGISDAQILTANTRLNPSLLSDNGVAELTYRLGIQQTVELGGKRKKRTALAQAQKDVVLSEICTTLLDLRSNIRSTYIQLYNTQQKYNAANDILITTVKLSDISKKRQIAGEIATLDVLQSEITMVNAKNDLQKAKLEILQAFNALNTYMGQCLKNGVELAPPNLLPEFANSTLMPKAQNDMVANKLVEQAFCFRPEIKNIFQSIEVANRKIEVARANIVPNLQITAGPDVVLPGGEESSKTNFNVFVIGSLELPIFNRQQGAIKEALAEKCQLEKELESVKNQIALEVKNAYSGIISNAESIRIYENELMPKACDVVNKSRRSFEEGKSNILIPLNAQQSYINTRFGYIQTLTEYQKAVSDLERAIGAGQ